MVGNPMEPRACPRDYDAASQKSRLRLHPGDLRPHFNRSQKTGLAPRGTVGRNAAEFLL